MSRASDMLRWIGALGVAVIAAARCVIAFAPQVVFDFDPLVDPHPFAGLGPAGSLWLDASLLAACAAGLLGEALAGRRVSLLMMILALIPVPVVIWHASQEAGHLWRGMTWAAAAIAAVTASHLGRDRTIRVVMLAVLLSIIAPLVIRGAGQVYLEHPAMVGQYQKQKAEILRDRGWEPDSSQARIFERRLAQAEPTGWFVTTNVYASVLGACMILALGATVAAVGRTTSGHVGAMALTTLAAAWAVWGSGSKGAIGAAALGLIATMSLLLADKRRSDWPLVKIAAQWFVPGAILAALLAVVVRGALLSEAFAGDRSLLFRWHYLVGAVRVLAGHWLTGVGPDGFTQAYMAVRLPRSTEEVASAHNVFADWLTMLGIAGAAWIVMVMILSWRAGRAVVVQTPGVAPAGPRSTGLVAGLAAVLAVSFGLMLEWPTINAPSLFLRALGVLGAGALAVMFVFVLRHAGDDARGGRVLRLATLTAIGALLMHAQIEMTFFQPGAVVWCMTLVGLAGASHAAADPAGRVGRLGIVAGAALAIGAMMLIVRGAMHAWMQQIYALKAASTVVHPAADFAGQSRQREAASLTLLGAYERWSPANVWMLEESARQLARASELAEGDRRVELLRRAAALAQQAADEFGRSSSVGLAMSLQWALARLTGGEESWLHATEMARRMTEIDPHGLTPWHRLGDVLWDADRRAEAADAYRRALECDAHLELDELKRLPEKDRAVIEQRITQAAGSP